VNAGAPSTANVLCNNAPTRSGRFLCDVTRSPSRAFKANICRVGRSSLGAGSGEFTRDEAELLIDFEPRREELADREVGLEAQRDIAFNDRDEEGNGPGEEARLETLLLGAVNFDGRREDDSDRRAEIEALRCIAFERWEEDGKLDGKQGGSL